MHFHSSPNRSRPRAAMQRILQPYLPFVSIHRDRLSKRLKGSSQTCALRNMTALITSTGSIIYANYSHFVQMIEEVFCSRQRDSLKLCMICLCPCTLVSKCCLREMCLLQPHMHRDSLVLCHIFCLSRVTLAGQHEIMSLLCLSISIKERQRLLTLKI